MDSNALLSLALELLAFLPFALAVSISFSCLRAPDLTLDGSFVLGAGIFSLLLQHGYSPWFASIFALSAGAIAGLAVGWIQRHGKIEPLLAGILAVFILTNGNLLIMGQPNINILTKHTLLHNAGDPITIHFPFIFFIMLLCSICFILLKSSFGLKLRAFAENPDQLRRLGYSVERIRLLGFSLTNLLAAGSGICTANINGYADIGMGFGMTLTGISTVIVGQKIYALFRPHQLLRSGGETLSCVLGVFFYFLSIHALLMFGMNPLYLKMFLGLMLIWFLKYHRQGRLT